MILKILWNFLRAKSDSTRGALTLISLLANSTLQTWRDGPWPLGPSGHQMGVRPGPGAQLSGIRERAAKVRQWLALAVIKLINEIYWKWFCVQRGGPLYSQKGGHRNVKREIHGKKFCAESIVVKKSFAPIKWGELWSNFNDQLSRAMKVLGMNIDELIFET